MLGNSGVSVNSMNLADWLVERASDVGGVQAEKDLTVYNDSDEFK